ncbi:MAG: penicillin acylase family protein [Cytophagales bacterium]
MLDLIHGWDRRGGAENIGAAQWNLYYNFMLSVLSENKVKIEDAIAQEYHEQALERTQDHLIKNFGRLDISLGDIQRHVRGEKNFPASGLIDMIAPTYSVPTDGGRLRAVSGESYIMLIRYTKDGPEVETVIPYGNSSDPESPHYTDQMLMYLDKKLKAMSLDREEVMADAVRVYNPI